MFASKQEFLDFAGGGQNFYNNDLINRMYYASGAGTPSGTSTVPEFLGQMYLDTSANAWYIAVGVSAASDFTAIAGGDIAVEAKVSHEGDADTYIEFLTDELNFYAGGVHLLKLEEDTQELVQFNPGGADVDFRVMKLGGGAAIEYIAGTGGTGTVTIDTTVISIGGVSITTASEQIAAGAPVTHIEDVGGTASGTDSAIIGNLQAAVGFIIDALEAFGIDPGA